MSLLVMMASSLHLSSMRLRPSVCLRDRPWLAVVVARKLVVLFSSSRHQKNPWEGRRVCCPRGVKGCAISQMYRYLPEARKFESFRRGTMSGVDKQGKTGGVGVGGEGEGEEERRRRDS